MGFKCEICGKIYKNKGTLTSKSHLNSKVHQEALLGKKPVKRFKKPITVEESKIEDLILFIAIKELNNPNYSNMLRFCTSFGMKTEIFIQKLFNRLKSGDILYTRNKDRQLDTIYSTLLNYPKLRHPFTIKVIDAYNNFDKFNFSSPFAVIEFFTEIRKKYPELVMLSSSKLGEREDLITFKRLFPNHIKFQCSNRWSD